MGDDMIPDQPVQQNQKHPQQDAGQKSARQKAEPDPIQMRARLEEQKREAIKKLLLKRSDFYSGRQRILVAIVLVVAFFCYIFWLKQVLAP